MMRDRVHAFELVGLGVAPYTLLSVDYRRYQACHGAPVLPGASCDYCGTGIVETFTLKGADGKTFRVGNECIRRAGDAGIISQSAEARKRARREDQYVRDDARIAAARETYQNTAVREALAAQPHPDVYRARAGQTALKFVDDQWQWAGRSGMVRAARLIEKAANERVALKLRPFTDTETQSRLVP